MAVKKSAATTEFQIPAPNKKIIKVKIEGTSPLIFHKWDEKAIKMMLDKQLKKAQKGRDIREPEREYEHSFYYNALDQVAFPSRNIKQAIVGSARFLNDVKMTLLRGTIFVMGDKDGFIPVLKNGKLITRKDVKKHTQESTDSWMRQDMVTVGMGSADIRFRGEIKDWSMEFLIEFDADLLSAEQVLNLLQRAGFSQGLGEWRAERNGESGSFQVAGK